MASSYLFRDLKIFSHCLVYGTGRWNFHTFMLIVTCICTVNSRDHNQLQLVIQILTPVTNNFVYNLPLYLSCEVIVIMQSKLSLIFSFRPAVKTISRETQCSFSRKRDQGVGTTKETDKQGLWNSIVLCGLMKLIMSFARFFSEHEVWNFVTGCFP